MLRVPGLPLEIPGPTAALISWLIAGFAVLLIALIYSELGGMYPRSGGPARFPHYSHGSIVGFTAGWMFWIATVTIAPIEVEAALQYATNYLHGLTHTNAAGVITLSGPGYAVAAVLLVLFTLVNLWGVSRMAKTNAAIVWWKVAVPIVTLAALFVVGFHGSNLTADGGFAQPERPPGGPHRALAGDGEKHPNIVPIHRRAAQSQRMGRRLTSSLAARNRQSVVGCHDTFSQCNENVPLISENEAHCN